MACQNDTSTGSVTSSSRPIPQASPASSSGARVETVVGAPVSGGAVLAVSAAVSAVVLAVVSPPAAPSSSSSSSPQAVASSATASADTSQRHGRRVRLRVVVDIDPPEVVGGLSP